MNENQSIVLIILGFFMVPVAGKIFEMIMPKETDKKKIPILVFLCFVLLALVVIKEYLNYPIYCILSIIPVIISALYIFFPNYISKVYFSLLKCLCVLKRISVKYFFKIIIIILICAILLFVTIPFCRQCFVKKIPSGYFRNQIMIPITYKIPKKTVVIQKNTFRSCWFLKKVILHDNVTRIEDYAFAHSPINSINLPNSVTYIGDNAFEGCIGLSEIIIPKSVTYIGNNAFDGCVNLKKVVFEDAEDFLGKKLILGDYVFNDCFGKESNLYYLDDELLFDLTKENIENKYLNNAKKFTLIFPKRLVETGIGVCNDCICLSKVVLPENEEFTNIQSAFFNNCVSLAEINIPKQIHTIGVMSFQNCKSLSNINLNNVSTIQMQAFKGSGLKSVDLLDNLIVFPEAFKKCKKLSKVLMNKAIRIEEEAFYDCEKLTDIEAKNMEYIGEYAFYNCGFKIFNIPMSLQKINNYAFYGCKQLKSFSTNNMCNYDITDGVLYNKDKSELIAFPINSNLNEYELPETVNKIREGAFCFINENINVKVNKNNKNYALYGNVIYDKKNNDLIFSFTNSGSYVLFDKDIFTIGPSAFRENNIKAIYFEKSNLKKISKNAFKDCKKLSQIYFSETLEEIDEYAFYGCEELKELYFSDNIIKISKNAFGNCNNLSKIVLPKNLKIIEEGAFSCPNENANEVLSGIIIPNSVVEIGKEAFKNCKLLYSVSIPKSCVSIGENVFAGCENLAIINCPQGYDISKLESSLEENDIKNVKFKRY